MSNQSKGNPPGQKPLTQDHSKKKMQSSDQGVKNQTLQQSSQENFANRDQKDRVNTDRDHSNKNFANRGNTDRDTGNDRYAHQGTAQGASQVVNDEEVTLRQGTPMPEDQHGMSATKETAEDKESRDPGFSSRQDRARESGVQSTARNNDVMSPSYSGKTDFVGQQGQKFQGQIRPHMPVVCSNEKQFATVDHLDGRNLKLTKDANGQHHFIPLSWVRQVDDKVHIDRPGNEAMQQWSTSPDLLNADVSGNYKQQGDPSNKPQGRH